MGPVVAAHTEKLNCGVVTLTAVCSNPHTLRIPGSHWKPTLYILEIPTSENCITLLLLGEGGCMHMFYVLVYPCIKLAEAAECSRRVCECTHLIRCRLLLTT